MGSTAPCVSDGPLNAGALLKTIAPTRIAGCHQSDLALSNATSAGLGPRAGEPRDKIDRITARVAGTDLDALPKTTPPSPNLLDE
jgi:hypothetical protein